MASKKTIKRERTRRRSRMRPVCEEYRKSHTEDQIWTLCSLDHPKIDHPDHSMYSYVLWLLGKCYLLKAKEVVDANT